MSLRLKLLLAQLPLFFALALLGFVAVSNVSRLGRQSEIILKENYRSVLAAQRMKEAIERLQETAIASLVTDRDAGPVESFRRRFEAELRAAEANVTEVGEVEVVQELRNHWELYLERVESLLSAPAEIDRRAAPLTLAPFFAAAKDQAQVLLDLNQDAMVRKSDRVQKEAGRLSRLMIGVAFAALLVGTLLSGMVTERLLRPLELLTRTVRRLGEGDFEARVDVPGRDEVAALAHDINGMAMRISDYRRSSLGELLLAQEASQAAIDSLPDPVVVFDLNGSILNLNRASETLLGLVLHAEGEPLDHVEPHARELIERVRSHVLAGKGAYVPRGFEEAVRITTPGGEAYLLPRAVPVHSEEGAVTGAAVILQDVTRLRRVDDLRNNLVSTVAHEFRTPLTSLRMAIHLCLEQAGGPLTPKQADLLYAAREECERLQAMVDELLDLARIQSGRIELHRVTAAPDSVVDTAIDAFRGLAEGGHVILEHEVSPHLPHVWVDREQVQLIFSNLLTNSIRHTPAGGHVIVRARVTEEESIRFEVADNGPGVLPEYRASIFEKFVRVPGAPSGAGLGLSIARDVVEAHGGRIGVEETPGGGATFWFTIPLAASFEDRSVAIRS